MSQASSHLQNVPSNKRTLGIACVLLAWFVCILTSLTHRKAPDYAVDYRSFYSSTRCLVADCNPYNMHDTMVQFLAQGGTLAEAGPPPAYGPFLPYYFGYPPTSIFYFIPLVLLKWRVSLFVWLAISEILFAFAAYCVADLTAEFSPLAANLLLAFFLLLGNVALVLAQPSMLACALCVIGVWSILRNRAIVPGILCFAFSLVMKPQLGGLLVLYFLLSTATHRKRALQVVALTIALCIPPLISASYHPSTAHWVHDMGVNIAGISKEGRFSDPGPKNNDGQRIINLQGVASFIQDNPKFYNPVAVGLGFVMLGFWLYPVLKLRPGIEKDVTALAALTAISLLPIYHRSYDARLLMLIFPAMALLIRRGGRWSIAAIGVSLALSLVTWDALEWRSRHHLSHLIARTSHSSATVRTIVGMLSRPLSLTVLAVAIFYLAVLYSRRSWEQQPARCAQNAV